MIMNFKVIILIIFLDAISKSLLAQDTIKRIDLIPIIKIENAINIDINKARRQSNIDTSRADVCFEKEKEYTRLKKLLSHKIDSLKNKVSELNNNQTSPYLYYLVLAKPTKDSEFDWDNCYRSLSISHDYVRLEMYIEKHKKSLLNMDGTSGQTFYRED